MAQSFDDLKAFEGMVELLSRCEPAWRSPQHTQEFIGTVIKALDLFMAREPQGISAAFAEQIDNLKSYHLGASSP